MITLWFTVDKFYEVDRKMSIIAFLAAENDTLLNVVIVLTTLSGVLLLLLIGVIYLIYKMRSTARNAIKKDVNPLYGIDYEEAEAEGKNEDPRPTSIDQQYDYMGS